MLLLLACADKSHEETAEALPHVDWLSPAEGDTVKAGTVAGAVLVEGFTLVSPAKHGEGEPEGYVRIAVDGVEALVTGGTTFDLELPAGAHTLEAALFYTDGDAVELADGALCEEGQVDCEAVAASITVTAK